MRSETRAVMLTDMKGFTAATLRQTRGENARMLALHDALLLPLVKAFGGVRVKTIGDAYLVVFRAATDALLCGMAIQDRLWDYNRRAAGPERMEVRVAVALGEVRVVKDGGAPDVFGDAVNLAARVEGEAPPGDVWFTEAAACLISASARMKRSGNPIPLTEKLSIAHRMAAQVTWIIFQMGIEPRQTFLHGEHIVGRI